jgi:putative ABC transport system permease protein
MRIPDIAKLSTRMFKTNPARTWLTILGMGVGTGAVVTLVGLGFGLQNIILEQIVLGDTLRSLNITPPPARSVTMNPQTVQEFFEIEHVEDVAPLASFAALITFEGFTGNTFLEGANANYFRFTGTKETAGRLFSEETPDDDRGSVIISSAMLKLFEVEDPETALGKQVSFRVFVPSEDGTETIEMELKKRYTIVGISSEESRPSAILLLDELSSQLAVEEYERVQVLVDNANFLDSVTEKIVEKGFGVTALSKTVEQAKKIFQGIQAVLAVFGGIALVVSAIGMFNTMTVTLLERTGEIGIMRTLGASSKDIKILFISEAVVVGFLGGVVGIMIGVGIGFSINTMVNILATSNGGKAVALFAYPPVFIMFIASFSAVVGFLTGVFPATRAAALNPLDAIRYK